MARSKSGATAPLDIHGHISILPTGDPLLLAELKTDRKIGPLLRGQFSGTFVVVAPGAEGSLTRHLRKARRLPKMRRVIS